MRSVTALKRRGLSLNIPLLGFVPERITSAIRPNFHPIAIAGGAVKQTIAERGRPRHDCTTSIQECAGTILENLEPDEVFQEKQRSGLQTLREYLVIHQDRLAFDLEYITQLVERDQRVLEIGGLPYMLTLPLMRKGYEVVAVDKPSLEWNEGALRRLGVSHHACDLDSQPLPFDADYFDVVLMNQVFAHLRMNLIHSMREIFRVLRPGGFLYLSSPNLRSFRSLANLLVRGDACAFMGSIYYNYSFLETYGHMGQIRVYTPREIEDFLTAMHFIVRGTICRGRVRVGRLSVVANAAGALWPSLRPDFTILAVKPT